MTAVTLQWHVPSIHTVVYCQIDYVVLSLHIHRLRVSTPCFRQEDALTAALADL